MRRFLLHITAVVAIAVAVPAHADTDEITSEQLRALARAAPRDPSALATLRRVTRVDGHPVDLQLALSGPGADRRLRILAGGAPEGTGVDAATARSNARRVLREPAFQRHDPPRPLRGPLERLGRILRPAFRPVGRALGAVFSPVGRLIGRVLDTTAGAVGAVVVVVAGVALATAMAIRRRTQRVASVGGAGERGRRADPAELERQAAVAERDGDLSRALRLRYQAGLLRLDAARVIEMRPSLTAGAIARRLRDPTLDDLTRTYDGVAYGGRSADAADLDAARTGWRRVLTTVAS